MGRTRFRTALVVAVILVLGTVGYRALGLQWMDALYQTVITISTVGYREVGEFGARHQVFSIVLIIFGAGTALYTLGVLIDTMFEARVAGHFWRRKMQRRIDLQTGHVVVCGYGLLGQAICEELTRAGKSVVIIDRTPPDRWDDTKQFAFLHGDATDDGVLEMAGLDHAATLVLALNSDVDNLFVALTARLINPEIFIVAQANDQADISKLHQAGADRVVNPNQIGGARMAALVAQPEVVDFLDVVMGHREFEVRIENFEIAGDSPLVGRALGEADIRGRTGCTILAIRHDETLLTNPNGKLVLEPGDVIIALGTEGHLKQLQATATGT